MKTQNELHTLKKEYEELGNKLRELTDEELEQVSGGTDIYNMDLGGNPEENTQKIGYCKYCHNTLTLTYVGSEMGWLGGLPYRWCNKWKCSNCRQNNFYTSENGNLL